MSEASSKASSAKEQVLADHREIRELTVGLEQARDLEELLRRLQEIRATLVPHFTAEEGHEGLYDLIRSLSPRQLGRVKVLEDEHHGLLADIDRVTLLARECLAGPVARVLAEAGVFARRLRKHEAAENSMLLDTMYTDLGQGD